jgi:hypothetical protein
LSRNERGGFGALKSDSTHHFFRNACTKSEVITVFTVWSNVCGLFAANIRRKFAVKSQFIYGKYSPKSHVFGKERCILVFKATFNNISKL